MVSTSIVCAPLLRACIPAHGVLQARRLALQLNSLFSVINKLVHNARIEFLMLHVYWILPARESPVGAGSAGTIEEAAILLLYYAWR